MVQWKRDSGLRSFPAPHLPFPHPSLSLAMVPKGPSRCPCTWAGHFLRRWLSPCPLWPSEIPSPPSLLPLAPGQGLAHLPAFSCLAVTHGVLTGSPFLAGMPLELLGVVFSFVGVPWSSCLLPSCWKRRGWKLTAGRAWGLASKFPQNRALQPFCARCLSGVSFIIIFKA